MKRLGLPKKLAQSQAAEAYQAGSGQARFKGKFRRYLDKLGREYQTSPIVHKGVIFIFGGTKLITAWPVPQQFRDYKPHDKPDPSV
jgi:hypothetical protein